MRFPTPLLTLPLLLATHAALAQNTAPPRPVQDQVIVPEVERREVKPPRFPSRDFSLGVFGGTYSTPNFGAKAVTGVRLGYHVTEDVFVEGTLGRSKVSDEDFRQIFPIGGVFPTASQKLSYYNVVAGYNVLPGEVFFGRNNAKASQGYLLAGIGSTDFAGQKRQTVLAGFGLRVIATDRFGVQADVRDHVYAVDLLGKRQTKQNLEVTAGLTVYF